jgi:hypothetical protein
MFATALVPRLPALVAGAALELFCGCSGGGGGSPMATSSTGPAYCTAIARIATLASPQTSATGVPTNAGDLLFYTDSPISSATLIDNHGQIIVTQPPKTPVPSLPSPLPPPMSPSDSLDSLPYPSLTARTLYTLSVVFAPNQCSGAETLAIGSFTTGGSPGVSPSP